MLTASGRLAGRTWQNALDQGTSTAQVGRLLVEQGHLTQGELELCVLGATYDAAYFTLAPTMAPVEFLGGATHWLGPIAHIDPAAVNREVRRRTKLLDDIFPDARVDTAAVTPVARPPRERVTLTALQWELLVHADGQRTPADLALLLGRAGFATIQELRRLAALGLLELPEVRAEAPEFVRLPRARGTAVGVPRSAVRPDDVPTVPVVAGCGRRHHPRRHPSPALVEPVPAEESTANGTVYRPPRLARRKPGAKLPKEIAAEPPQTHPGTDEVLLKRIRTALRALR
ncbi:ADAM 12 protein [Paractinoplanes durhamensis]|uniref:ADAM 12 protein n=1 Tax=Paractinoplanes durhamensis TaxID=113563 RepID=UPI00364327FC